MKTRDVVVTFTIPSSVGVLVSDATQCEQYVLTTILADSLHIDNRIEYTVVAKDEVKEVV